MIRGLPHDWLLGPRFGGAVGQSAFEGLDPQLAIQFLSSLLHFLSSLPSRSWFLQVSLTACAHCRSWWYPPPFSPRLTTNQPPSCSFLSSLVTTFPYTSDSQTWVCGTMSWRACKSMACWPQPISDSVGLRWGPRLCMSNWFPGDADPRCLVQELYFENHSFLPSLSIWPLFLM